MQGKKWMFASISAGVLVLLTGCGSSKTASIGMVKQSGERLSGRQQ